jgi:hypothetical protein
MILLAYYLVKFEHKDDNRLVSSVDTNAFENNLESQMVKRVEKDMPEEDVHKSFESEGDNKNFKFKGDNKNFKSESDKIASSINNFGNENNSFKKDSKATLGSTPKTNILTKNITSKPISPNLMDETVNKEALTLLDEEKALINSAKSLLGIKS